MEQNSQKKTTQSRNTNKKRQLSKLPAKLPVYNYDLFPHKDIQRAINYYQGELEKIGKLLAKMPQINKPSESIVQNPLPNGYAYPNSGIGDYPPYNRAPQSVEPALKMPATFVNPNVPGIPGPTMDMPMVFGGITPKAEILESPVVEDKSSELSTEINNLLNQQTT